MKRSLAFFLSLLCLLLVATGCEKKEVPLTIAQKFVRESDIYTLRGIYYQAPMTDKEHEDFDSPSECTSFYLFEFFVSTVDNTSTEGMAKYFKKGIKLPPYEEDRFYVIPISDMHDVLSRYFTDYNLIPEDIFEEENYDKETDLFYAGAYGISIRKESDTIAARAISEDMVEITSSYYSYYYHKVVVAKLQLKIYDDGYYYVSLHTTINE